MTPTTAAQSAARDAVVDRLEAYRAARETLHADVVRASELGLSQSAIARASGLTRQGVAKILDRAARPVAPSATPDLP